MSDDERSKKRTEHEDEGPDVEAHSWEIDDPNDDDPEKKRKGNEFEDDDAELGKKKK
jgi:hypothetical protein